MKIQSLLLITILIAITITGCSNHDEPLLLSLNVWPGYAHPLVAKELGIFEDQGVIVDITVTKTYQENIDNLINGKTDAAFLVFNDAIMLKADGIPIKVVAIADYSAGADVLVSNNEIRSVTELENKTIGVTELNGFSHFFILSLLNEYNVDTQTVKMVPVAEDEIVSFLNKGLIDAGHTWEPELSKALDQGNRILATSADVPGVINDVLVVREEVLIYRPQDVKNMIKGIFQSRELIIQKDPESFLIVQDKTGMTPGTYDEGLLGVHLTDKAENIIAFTDEQKTTSLYAQGRIYIDHLLKENIIDYPIDMNDILDTSYIE